jgi:hypothetical protein
MTTLKTITTAAIATALLGWGASAAVAAVADPDRDGDLVCPPGATDPSYCTEDETGPTVGIAPGTVTLTRAGFAWLGLTCRAPAHNRCIGRLALTITEPLGSRSFSIVARRATWIAVHISLPGQRLIGDSLGHKLVATARVVARYADNRNRTTTRRVTLKAFAGGL